MTLASLDHKDIAKEKCKLAAQQIGGAVVRFFFFFYFWVSSHDLFILLYYAHSRILRCHSLDLILTR